VISGGYIDAKKYSAPLLQVDYKSGKYLWLELRPQATFLLSKFGSGYIGLGFGWELYLTKQIILIPSFSPGFYWKGRGKDLGYPIEFRSALEISFEMKNKMRIGVQISHISNAHLSHRNPGFNALILTLAIPLKSNLCKFL
jgi:lipid A 3-O-deacylase